MKKKINHEQCNEETIHFVSNPFLPLPILHRISETQKNVIRNEIFCLNNLKDDSTSFVKCENQYGSIERRTSSSDDNDYQPSSIFKYSSGHIIRSQSTSTSLQKSHSMKSSLISFVNPPLFYFCRYLFVQMLFSLKLLIYFIEIQKKKQSFSSYMHSTQNRYL